MALNGLGRGAVMAVPAMTGCIVITGHPVITGTVITEFG
jgi:hypothetical protein